MSWYVWVGIVWLACAVVMAVWLNWAQRHAPMDPSEDSDGFPEAWLWPAREAEDASTVRHGGLGK